MYKISFWRDRVNQKKKRVVHWDMPNREKTLYKANTREIINSCMSIKNSNIWDLVKKQYWVETRLE
jgi:hypothetical protein